MNADKPLIEIKNLTKSFGKVNALKNISTNIYPGEVVFIVGPSGSGKSTFLRCMNRLEEATEGQVIFEGANIMDKKINIDQHRQKMGMVFQHFNLFPHLTIRDNITLAPES